MNYLAHLALSGEQDEIMVGNFMADFVKGKKYKAYPEEIQKGIILHRKIDYYTDTHEIIGEGLQLIYKDHGKFSGILMDMYLDFFLARKFQDIYDTSVSAFQTDAFKKLEKFSTVFPQPVDYMFTYMKKGKWLERYQTKNGLEKSLKGLSSRIKYENNIDDGITTLEKYHDELEVVFDTFYPQIQNMCLEYIG